MPGRDFHTEARCLVFSGSLRDSNSDVSTQIAVVPEILRNRVGVTAAACDDLRVDRL
jgi:hypothetical protein